MNTPSLNAMLGARMSNPAVDLLTRTTAALRADAGYFQSDDDTAGGVFLSGEKPARMAGDALALAMARIDDDDARNRHAAEQAHDGRRWADELARLPSPLRETALDAVSRRNWSFGGFGIRRLALMLEDGALAELMRVEPGCGAADHDHAGDEFTLVVTGAYRDSEGLYQPGDVSLARPGFHHAPRTEPGEVCYLLAVTYGPPKFSGRFGVLQRAIGFPWTPVIAKGG